MITANPGQERIIQAGIDFIHNSSEQVFQFSGGPGTGKSFTLNEIIRRAGVDRRKVLPMAYTGAAAIVMRCKGLLNATTIHSGLYAPVKGYKRDDEGNVIMNNYIDRPISDVEFVPKDTSEYDLFVFDEGSMIPMAMRKEIERRGKKIIVCGDLNQLPPVNDEPAYLTNGKVYMLTEIMRQAAHSAIPYIADRALRCLPIHKGLYGDVLVIEEDELTDQMLLGADDIICGKNATREKINNHIRHDLFKFNTDLPLYMEKVICRRNNRSIEVANINLANGLAGRVLNAPDISGMTKNTFTMSFKPDRLEAAFPNLICDYEYFTAPFDKKNMLKNNKYNQAEKFEFSYAKTTHLAQGSQSHHGIYIQEYLSKEINNQLNYTGITRFETGLIYVLPKRRFY